MTSAAKPTAVFDLNQTKDSGLIGAIGETIAWQYLWERGLSALELGCGRPSFKAVPRLDGFARKDGKHGLEDAQARYLEALLANTKEWSWDFVACLGNQAYLIEVKTSRPRKPKDGLRSDQRKGMSPDSLRRAKQLGFKMLLVNVELLDDWQCKVTQRELLADE